MSIASKLESSAKSVPEPRAILGLTGKRVRVSKDSRKKTEVLKKAAQKKEMPQAVVKNNLSADSTCSMESSNYSSCSSFSSSSGSSVKVASPRRNVKRSGLICVKVVPDGGEWAKVSPAKSCDWIAPHSEWGVPVHDDTKLFELLVFSQALAEMSWTAILNMRDIFRKLFDNFDPSSVAQFTEKKLLSLKVNGNLLLSEPKLRVIVENAKLLLKVQQEFGSFSYYCWRFVNHKPLRNGFRYARQLPVKTPKAEFISKDLMRRGFCCVGPTVVYSFMQAAGIVNDHLVTC